MNDHVRFYGTFHWPGLDLGDVVVPGTGENGTCRVRLPL